MATKIEIEIDEVQLEKAKKELDDLYLCSVLINEQLKPLYELRRKIHVIMFIVAVLVGVIVGYLGRGM